MFRIAALNESDSSDDSQEGQCVRESTKEAKEVEAFSLYSKALSLLRHGDSQQAETVFRDLIDHDFLLEAMVIREEHGQEAIHPGLQLLYAIYKNLAVLATQRSDYRAAMEAYLQIDAAMAAGIHIGPDTFRLGLSDRFSPVEFEMTILMIELVHEVAHMTSDWVHTGHKRASVVAVRVDDTEVTVWYKTGLTALKIEDFQLAMIAFAEGLACSPKHWLCLDQLITLQYALNNYSECLYHIAKAFEMEAYYEKGHALRNKMYAEQPGLQYETEGYFKDCPPEISTVQIDPVEAKQFVEEALKMRARRHELIKPPEPVRLQFPVMLKEYSWKYVGNILVDLYDKAATSDPPISMTLKMDVPDYTNIPVDSTGDNLKNKPATPTDSSIQENLQKKMDVSESDEAGLAEDMEVDTDTPGTQGVTATVTQELVQEKQAADNPSSNNISTGAAAADIPSAANDTPKTKETDTPKIELESTVRDSEEKFDVIHNVEMHDESDSVLEALNTAHSLLDSLSPVRPNTNQSVDQNLHRASPLTKEENNVPVQHGTKADSQTSKPAAVKSLSFGFSVSHILSPDYKASAPNLKDDEALTGVERHPETNVSSTGSVGAEHNLDIAVPSGVKLGPDSVSSLDPIVYPSTSHSSATETRSSEVVSSSAISSSSVITSSVSSIAVSYTAPLHTSTTLISESKPSSGMTSSVESSIESTGTERNYHVNSLSFTTSGSPASAVAVPQAPVISLVGSNNGVRVPWTSPSRVTSSALGIQSSRPVLASHLLASTTTQASTGTLVPPGIQLSTNFPELTSVAGTFLSSAIAASTQRSLPTPAHVPTVTTSSVFGDTPRTSSLNLGKCYSHSSPTQLTNTSAGALDLTVPKSPSNQGSAFPYMSNMSSPRACPPGKDHEYSKSRASQPYPQGSRGFFTGSGVSNMPGKVPATQSLMATVDPYLLEISSGRSSMETSDKSPFGRKGQKRRRVSLVTEELMLYGKRRSARVRNTGRKKEEESVNLCDLLHEFLPSSLKNTHDVDASMDARNEETGREKISTEAPRCMSPMVVEGQGWNEEEEVKAFLKLCLKNQGLIETMNVFLHNIARHSKVKWPAGVVEVYMEVFNRARKHLYMPNVFDTSDSNEVFQELAQICLVQAELQLDSWLTRRMKLGMSPAFSPIKSHADDVLHLSDIPRDFDGDLRFLSTLCGQSDRLDHLWIDHCVRVYWLKARYSILRGNMDEAIYCYERTKEYLEYGKEEGGLQQVVLPNCSLDNQVNLELVASQHDMLQKTQSVEETQRLYESGQFDKVVEILLQTFTPHTHKSKIVKVVPDPEERQSQLYLLQEALFKAGNHEKCIVWGEESLNEAYQQHRRAKTVEDRSAWAKTMGHIFSALCRVLEKPSVSIGKSLPLKKLARLSQNLIKLIDSNMAETVLPWILLYWIVKEDDAKTDQERAKDSDGSDDDEEDMCNSQKLLMIAHDYLGGRSWCTKMDGTLLIFFMKVLQDKMDGDSACLEEFQQSFEQCVYCLYGHPNKRGKARHLQDHGSPMVELSFEQAVSVFDYFKPKTLPEFDGYRSETISAEIECLLKRIIPLIPEESRSEGVPIEVVYSYIEGAINSPPSLPDGKRHKLPVVEEIYYLLADYYLKNKEVGKAIKSYIQDLCINPGRLDSWAGMALARMSQLDSKLTSTDLKMDTPMYKKSIAALRCFKRAAEIEDCNVKLWIEYGTLAYQLHSHASRQIRWEKWFKMEEEVVQIAVESKREMLQTALNCFRMASECDEQATEEEWLHNYMHGKCLEKMHKHVDKVVPYYFKAMNHLYEDNAKFPKKITFNYTAPHLAVESLELYYRIHVIILKHLLKHPYDSDQLDYQLYLRVLLQAADTPFARRKEKGHQTQPERDSASSADENSCSGSPSPTKKESHSADHTYFRQKSNPAAANTETTSQAIEVSQGTQDSLLKGVPNSEAVVENVSKDKAPTVVTLELHSEEQASTSTDNITLTTTECAELVASKRPSVEDRNDNIAEARKEQSDKSSESKDSDSSNGNKNKSAVDIPSDCGDKGSETNIEVKPLDGEAAVNVKEEPVDVESDSSVEDIVKNVINHIKDCIEAQMDNSTSGNRVEKMETEVIEVKAEETDVSMEVASGETPVTGEQSVQQEDGTKPEDSSKEGHTDGIQTNEMNSEAGATEGAKSDDCSDGDQKTRVEEVVQAMLKKPAVELHRELIEQCRKALELCLLRFPTHYKSFYRLAHLYQHSPYHKDLTKAHHILLGAPKWKELEYMPCQGLFGERKQNKFFQGIWKIPIDEIDRAGSFPSHLNRCIQLVLDVLKEERDALTIHQVHLQLNRHSEPGKKYLRDAEKRYYAVTSHRYSLEAAEKQLEVMKKVADSDLRLHFLVSVYNIWEHGVHKLNKYAERSHRLLAESYRVALRKLETLPQKMLLDQAIRFCKHQLLQRGGSKADKSQDSRSQGVTPKLTQYENGGNITSTQKQLTLDNIMKSQPNNTSLLKSQQATTKPSLETHAENTRKVSAENCDDDVIVISDSSLLTSPSPTKPTSVPVTPAVKRVKMGLLQAAKRLKPNSEEESGKTGSGDSKPVSSAASEEDESETPIPSGLEGEGDSLDSTSSSSTSASSSSDSSSSESEGDEDEVDGDSDDSEDTSANDTPKKPKTAKVLKPTDKPALAVRPVVIDDDEEESSDNEDEIDLISSDGDEKDNDNDKDYIASDDEPDVIMVSDDEFTTKGRAVIPSPPHRNRAECEVLVEKVPDFDPLISTIMLSESDSASVGRPVSVASVARPVHGTPVGRPGSQAPRGRPVSGVSVRGPGPRAPLGRPRQMAPRGRPPGAGYRPMSPGNRQMTPGNRPMTPNSRPMTPGSRTMSPGSRPMSPGSRAMSPGYRPMANSSRAMTPGSRPMSPGIRPVPVGPPVPVRMGLGGAVSNNTIKK